MNELITTRQIESAADHFCRQCGNNLSPSDNFCRHCGTVCRDLFIGHDPAINTSVSRFPIERPSVVIASDGTQMIKSVLNNRLAVIAIIAFIGPMGLPALWFSPRFANRTKIVTSIVYLTLTTIVPLVIIWYWLEYSLRPLVEVFGS